MTPGLPPNLSYCLIDGRAIFLDIDRDQYFRLEPTLERAFLSYVHGEEHAANLRQTLVERGILSATPMSGNFVHHDLAPPSQSLIESHEERGRPRLADILQVLLTVHRFRRQLKSLPLASVLRSVRLPDIAMPKLQQLSAEAPQLLDTAGRFMQARRIVPIETSCLLDSLSLISYLGRQGMSASLVFGVTDDPFSAHCWVQTGSIVLNDTVGNAMAHTPIRVV